MKMVDQYVCVLRFESTVRGMYKAVEYAARVCTHTTHNMSVNSRIWVSDKIINAGTVKEHGRPLEFGTAFLTLPWYRVDKMIFYFINPYSRIRKFRYVTTNLRVLVENGIMDDLRWFGRSAYHIARPMFLFLTSRVQADSARTHVSLSTQMESSRCCNYVGKRFGEDILFVRPMCWGQNEEVDRCMTMTFCEEENSYKFLKSVGAKSEDARDVLGLQVKTEYVQCGFPDAWENFFALRCYPTEHNHPHPDMQDLACKAKELYDKTVW